jgi:uncharacterized protein YbaR (Trm112 family)
MKEIKSSGDFAALLAAERAVVFIFFAWSNEARESRTVFASWAAENIGVAACVMKPDELPFTWQWLNEALGNAEGEAPSSGAVVWLKHGAVAGWTPDAARAGVRTLARLTREYFGQGDIDATAGLDAELLKTICCPETHQELKLAASPVVEKLNEAIAGGRVQNRAGIAVTEKINGGLVRRDGRYLYPVRQNIPVLLVDEAIAL